MKILEIIPDLNKRAGAEVFFNSLCQELAKDKDLQISVIVIWDKIDKSFDGLKSHPRIKFYCCGKTKKGINIKVIKKFKRIVLFEQPDIIHTHRSVLLTYFLSFGLKKRKWKYFHTVHNIANKEAGKYEILLRKIYVKRKLLMHIGISNRISDSIKELYNAEPTATIYNGISFTPEFSVEKKFDFICLARFSKQKNHLFLLESFKELLSKFSSSKLLLVGEGELENECKSFCENNHLDENVIFYGASSCVAPLLAQSKSFVLGSLYEGNPISILEAMSSGLPIIAPNVGGVPDVVENNKNGFLFEVNCKEELVGAMEKIFDDELLVNEISKNNINKSKIYTMERCANFYKEIFRIK